MRRGNVLGELKGDGVFCPGVASRQDQGRLFQSQKVVRLVDVAAQVVVAVVADEVVCYWDACR